MDYEKELGSLKEDLEKAKDLKCTPNVRQYVILKTNRRGAFSCQKENRTNDIHQNLRFM